MHSTHFQGKARRKQKGKKSKNQFDNPDIDFAGQLSSVSATQI